MPRAPIRIEHRARAAMSNAATRHALLAATLIAALLLTGAISADAAHGDEEHGAGNGSAFVVESLVSQDDATVLEGRLEQPVAVGDTAFFETLGAPVVVSIDGQIAYASDDDAPPQSEAFGYGWSSFRTPELSSGSSFEVVAFGPNGNAAARQFAASLFVGDGIDLLRGQLHVHGLQLLAGNLIIMLGFAYVTLLVLLRRIKSSIAGSYAACGAMLVAGGVCSLIDYDYITLVANNVAAVNWMDFLSQVASLGSLLMYLRAFFSTPRMRKAAAPLVPTFAVSVLAGILLVAVGAVTLRECVAFLVPMGAALLVGVLVLLVIDFRRDNNAKTKLLLQSGSLLAVFTLVEMVHFIATGTYWIVVFQVGLMVFGILQIVILGKDAAEQLLRAERMEKAESELAQNRIKIMLSQIQPHFLYNTLAAIARLCDKDPRQAKQATVQFADYLRWNMDSLSQTTPVPFERELKHVQLYLSLEQMRFGDDLRIVYDVAATDFTLPSLSVQPLVENAVRYGVGKKEEGGTVRVSTRETAAGIEVVVEDDGVGFDPRQTQDDGRTHVGIDSVTSRLKSMLSATLSIESSPGHGTMATITIPREAEQR